MTFEQYKTECQKRHLAYCAAEQKRMDKLMKFWFQYKEKASKLGYHALDPSEIIARKNELRRMAARVDETHGENLRSWFELHEAS